MPKSILFTTFSLPNIEKAKYLHAALSSWKYHDFKVVVFGESNLKSICDRYDFILETDFDKDCFHMPIVKDLFLKTQTNYSDFDFYMYVNSDIIFHANPMIYINNINIKHFMVVGQRRDIYNFEEKVDYLSQDYAEIESYYESLNQKDHDYGGIDFWGFTKGFWDLGTMPPFRIARGRFDHWLTGFAIENGKGPVIDLSHVWKPLQPEPLSRKNLNIRSALFNFNFKNFIQFYINRYYFLKANIYGTIEHTQKYMNIDGEILNKL